MSAEEHRLLNAEICSLNGKLRKTRLRLRAARKKAVVLKNTLADAGNTTNVFTYFSRFPNEIKHEILNRMPLRERLICIQESKVLFTLGCLKPVFVSMVVVDKIPKSGEWQQEICDCCHMPLFSILYDSTRQNYFKYEKYGFKVSNIHEGFSANDTGVQKVPNEEDPPVSVHYFDTHAPESNLVPGKMFFVIQAKVVIISLEHVRINEVFGRPVHSVNRFGLSMFPSDQDLSRLEHFLNYFRPTQLALDLEGPIDIPSQFWDLPKVSSLTFLRIAEGAVKGGEDVKHASVEVDMSKISAMENLETLSIQNAVGVTSADYCQFLRTQILQFIQGAELRLVATDVRSLKNNRPGFTLNDTDFNDLVGLFVADGIERDRFKIRSGMHSSSVHDTVNRRVMMLNRYGYRTHRVSDTEDEGFENDERAALAFRAQLQQLQMHVVRHPVVIDDDVDDGLP